MQFLAVLAVFLTAVSAIPTGTDATHEAARELGVSIARRSIGSTICNGAVSRTFSI